MEQPLQHRAESPCLKEERSVESHAKGSVLPAPSGGSLRPCVVQDANLRQQLAGGNSSWYPELESRTTHHLSAGRSMLLCAASGTCPDARSMVGERQGKGRGNAAERSESQRKGKASFRGKGKARQAVARAHSTLGQRRAQMPSPHRTRPRSSLQCKTRPCQLRWLAVSVEAFQKRCAGGGAEVAQRLGWGQLRALLEGSTRPLRWDRKSTDQPGCFVRAGVTGCFVRAGVT